MRVFLALLLVDDGVEAPDLVLLDGVTGSSTPSAWEGEEGSSSVLPLLLLRRGVNGSDITNLFQSQILGNINCLSYVVIFPNKARKREIGRAHV